MLILASGSTAYIGFGGGHPCLGGLITPQYRGLAAHYIKLGAKWAMDNGCFNGLDAPKFLTMLKRNKADASSCLWCVVPDVFIPGKDCAAETLESFHLWKGVVKAHGYPLALVAQCGLEKIEEQVPWDEIACLFIGGDDAWKEGPHARYFCELAKSKGKWVHMGRVNSQRRLYIAASMGVDSIDGLGFSKFGALRWGLPQAMFYSLSGSK